MMGRGSLAVRLLVAQALVGVLGAATLWAVAALVGPEQFRRHLLEAGELSPALKHHAEQAFQDATTISFAAAFAAGGSAALLLSIYLSRRLGREVGTVARAAAALATGHLDARIRDPGLGEEFARLADAFNDMAGRLQATEQTRRRMLADLAHELRTPLAVLDGYLEGIQDGVRRADAQTMEVLRAQTGRLARLAQDIAEVSEAEEGQVTLDLQPVQVDTLVGAAVTTARGRYEAKGVTLRVASGDELVVNVDVQRLGQVLGNLLDNALRHTPPGGSVEVRTAASDDSAVIEVVDTGEGIPEGSLGKVFERFYRADTARDRDHGGAGIGLAISKALVEAHGGSITARSGGPGRGAAFELRLPARRAGLDK